MGERLPVIAAIPNFNMGQHLGRLLSQVLEQGYDAVFVLDDASTDHSVEVVEQFGSAVKLVRSRVNQGAGANRNQILDHVGDDALIHFVDADMDLETVETAEVARQVFARYRDLNVGLIGGLVRRLDGSQEPHNYGAVFSAWGGITSGIPLAIDRLRTFPRVAALLQHLAAPIMKDWPNVLEAPIATPAYWLHEGNMLAHAGILRSTGGYDPRVRCHEAQDLAIRMEKRGIKRQFDPTIRVRHHHIDVRGRNRSRWANKAIVFLIREHGVWRWLTER